MASFAQHAEAPTEQGRVRPLSPVDRPIFGDLLHRGANAGNYAVESTHARGGFATVYEVRHVKLDRPAALKVLHAQLAGSPAMIRRFRLEAETANRIRHPNVVDIYDLGELTDGRPYLVMEWLAGPNLDE